MAEKYIFISIKYPKANTGIAALSAIMDLMQKEIVSLKDAVAVTKTEMGDLELHLAPDYPAGKGFLNGRLIGVIFADLFGVVGWDINDALAGTAYSILGQGVEDNLLLEFGEKMTPEESAVTLLVEHVKWRRAIDIMREYNFQGLMVISRNVIGDLTDVEKQLEEEKMVVFLPEKEAEMVAFAPEQKEEMITPMPEKEAETIVLVPEKEETIAPVPEKLVIPIPKGLKYIEGIGEIHSEKLRAAGIRNVQDLLDKGCNPQGREEIANTTGISEKLVLRWINQADLYRIHGIGKEYAELLEAAGVDTVPELAQRVPANLLEKMTASNAQRKMVRRLPVLPQVESWVSQAKGLPRKISY